MQCYVPFHMKEKGTPTALILPAGKCFPEDYNWISGTLCRRGYLVYGLYQRGYGSGIPEVNDNAGPIQKQDMRDAFHCMKQQEGHLEIWIANINRGCVATWLHCRVTRSNTYFACTGT